MRELCWMAVEQFARLLLEWAGRRNDLHVSERYFPKVVEQAWDHAVPKRTK